MVDGNIERGSSEVSSNETVRASHYPSDYPGLSYLKPKAFRYVSKDTLKQPPRMDKEKPLVIPRHRTSRASDISPYSQTVGIIPS
jgi:hypothetical protein